MRRRAMGKRKRDRQPPIWVTITEEVAEHQGDEHLTDRELEVLKSVAAGNSNKIVADRLGITEETVRTHMRSVLSKLSANDRTHAVTIALKRGYSL
jgi:DNA-binding NarL/FixJ family response regulator